MELVGEQTIVAAQEDVWRALNDPAVLRACVPGCESIEQTGDNEYKIVMLAAVGPVKARFTGALAIRNAVPPDSYELVFEGSGGAAGFGKGSATVALAPSGAATLLRYQANAQVGGRLAQVGSRLIDSVAKKLALQFFERFNRHFTPGEPAASAAAAPAPHASRPVAPRTTTTASPDASQGPLAVAGGAELVTPLRVIAAATSVGALALVGILFKLMAM